MLSVCCFVCVSGYTVLPGWEGGSKAIELLCLTHGRNSDRKFPFAAAPGWNDKGMKKSKPEIQHFIILHHSVSLTAILNTTQGQLDRVLDTSKQSVLISQRCSGINHTIHGKCYKITYSLFTFFTTSEACVVQSLSTALTWAGSVLS